MITNYLLLRKSFLLKMFVALFPFFWLTGFHMLVVPFFCVLYFLLKKKNEINFSFDERLAVLFFILSSGRVLHLILTGDAQFNRVVASIYNLFLLFSGFLLYLTISRSSSSRHAFVSGGDSVFVLLLVSHYFVFLVSIIYSNAEISHPTFFGMIFSDLDLTGILASAKTAIYTRPEWGLGFLTPRNVVLAEFPTSSALVLVGFYTCFAFKNKLSESPKKLFLFDGLVLIAIAFTFSRVVFLSFIISTLITYLRILKKDKVLAVVIYTISIPVFILLSLEIIEKIYDLYSLRESSADVRFTSYMLAIQILFNDSPIFGIGYKPYFDNDLPIPIGSHSTLISISLKYGIVGVLLLAPFLFFRPVFYFLYRPKSSEVDVLLQRFLIVSFFWMMFQDVDAYVYPMFFIFSILGLALHRKRNEIPETL